MYVRADPGQQQNRERARIGTEIAVRCSFVVK